MFLLIEIIRRISINHRKKRVNIFVLMASSMTIITGVSLVIGTIEGIIALVITEIKRAQILFFLIFIILANQLKDLHSYNYN